MARGYSVPRNQVRRRSRIGERVAQCFMYFRAYSRPFTGEISVGPELLKQVITSESASTQP